jgi:hypothetical protein
LRVGGKRWALRDGGGVAGRDDVCFGTYMCLFVCVCMCVCVCASVLLCAFMSVRVRVRVCVCVCTELADWKRRGGEWGPRLTCV